VVIDNSSITVSNNNIQDYYNSALASNGIFVASNSSAWTITGNKLFQTNKRTATATASHRGINIVSASGVGYTISNNIIGFSDASRTGTTTYDGAFGNRFFGIEMNVGITGISTINGNTISGINLSNTVGTAVTVPGIFSGISVLGGNVNIGTTSGNTIGGTSGNGTINITATATGHYIGGIYTTSIGTLNIQNNNIGSISAGGASNIGYVFHGINTVGVLGDYNITGNTIGSLTTANSIAIGIDNVTTTGVNTFNGITNSATGNISITNNTIQNTIVYGTGASVFNGILNSGGSGTLNITYNSIRLGTNEGTGGVIAISNTAAVPTLNINNNIIRSFTRAASLGAFTGISVGTAAVSVALNIKDNQFGNTNGGLITYTAANSATLTGISVAVAGASNTCALTITGNDFRGILYDQVTGGGVHTYIINAAATLTQNISDNTFTNLDVNTTGNVTFISNNVALFASGSQTVSGNKIVDTFKKGGSTTASTITLYTSTGIHSVGSVVNHLNNDFSNITATLNTIIAGWSITGAGLATQTITGNKFDNWAGGTSAITAMNINGFGGQSSVSSNTITKISGGAAITGLNIAAAGIASKLDVNSNTINNLSSTGNLATAAVYGITSSNISPQVNIKANTISNLSTAATLSTTVTRLSGIYVTAATKLNVEDNTIFGLIASGTATPVFTGITIGSTGDVVVKNNSVHTVSTSGADNTLVYTFNGIATSGATGNFSIENNIIGKSDGVITIGNATTTAGVNTFIGISNAATGTISILGNTVQNASALGSGISVVTGISNSGGSGTLTLTGNSVLSCTNAGSGIFTAILNTAGVRVANINNNIIRSHTKTNALGTFLGISSTGALTDALNINNNQLGNSDGGLITYVNANSAAITGINVATATAGCALSIQSNDFRGIVHAATGTTTSTHNYIINTAVTLSQNISSNTFTNLNVNTTGNIAFITNNVSLFSNGIQNINSNSIVTGFTRTSTAASGTLTLYTTAAVSAPGSTINNNNNNFSNITVSGGSIIAGWINTDAGYGTKNIKDNIFNNWTGANTPTGAFTGITVSTIGTNNAISGNQISNFTAGGNITGITTAAGNDNIFSNTIYSLTSSGITATTLTGIAITAGTTKTIYLNKIYNISATGAITTGNVNGISNALASVTMKNNLVGDLNASAGNGADIVRGISILSGSANLYYNTINLWALSSGTTFGTSGVYRNAAASLEMINNLIVNLSTPNVSGRTVAFRSSAVGLANYSSASDNNSFYAGTVGPNNLIFYDGTNSDQQIVDFQTRAATKDQASVSVNPTFISTTGSNIDFLHLQTSNCELEGAGKPITGITTDFDNETRGSSKPDIGADEFDGAKLPVSVSIAALPSGVICSGTSVTFTASPVNGGSPIYQWYNGVTPIGGESGSTYISTTLADGAAISVKMTSDATCVTGPATSNIITVSVNDSPAPSFSPPPGNDPCANDDVVYTTQTGQLNYNWNVPGTDGVDYIIISGGIGLTSYSVTLKWLTSGSKTVTANYSNGTGCNGNAASSTLTVHPVPTIGIFN